MELPEWINAVNKVAGAVPMTLLANKVDLKNQRVVMDDEIDEIIEKLKREKIAAPLGYGDRVDVALDNYHIPYDQKSTELLRKEGLIK
jgi:GTPase SAR1 family protein